MMKVSESNIEMNVSKYACNTGWWTSKFTSPSRAGVPDRIFIKNGKTLFIEFKATGEKPRKLQLEIMKQMREKGAIVYVVDDIQTGKDILDNETN